MKEIDQTYNSNYNYEPEKTNTDKENNNKKINESVNKLHCADELTE